MNKDSCSAIGQNFCMFGMKAAPASQFLRLRIWYGSCFVRSL